MRDNREIVSRDQVLAAAQRQEDLQAEAKSTNKDTTLPIRPAGDNIDGKPPGGRNQPSQQQQKKQTKKTEKKLTDTKKQLREERKALGACYKCGSLKYLRSFYKS